MSFELECPVDLVPVNQNKIRLIAFFVWVLAVTFWFTQSITIPAFLVADFALRAINLQQYSPLALMSGAIIKRFSIKNSPTDQAPKRFAARMGLTIIAMMLAFAYFGLNVVVNVITLMLVFFSFLESFFGICVGCHVYTLGLKLGRVFIK